MKPLLRIIIFIFVFTASVAYAGGVTVYEPKKGARLIAGKTYTIKWRFEYEMSNPMIELYDPMTNAKVGTIATPSNSNYNVCGTNIYCQKWKVPSNMNQCVRAIKITIGSATGYSGDFRIMKKLKLITIPKEKINLNN